MIIVNAQEIKKYYGASLVLNGVTLQIQEKNRIGLIGCNGSGKSTLLKLISGYERVDEGMLTVKKELKIGYLPQIPDEFDTMTVYEVLASGFKDLMGCKKALEDIELQMASSEAIRNPDLMERLLKSYSTLQQRFELGGGYDVDTMIEQVASGLQIDGNYHGTLFRTLSGGEKTKVALASQLVLSPELLLLDEPTNHLDMEGIEWLEQFLIRYEGAVMIVSHDRYFLDAVGTTMIEMEDGEAHVYYTNYSGYVMEKELRLLQQFAQYKEEQKQVKKMKDAIRQYEEWGRISGNEKFFKRAASIRKALERMELTKRPVLERKSAQFELTPLDRSGQRVLSFEVVTKQFGDRHILKGSTANLLYGEKVVLIGNNGSGKSTLFKILLGEIAADSGKVELGARVDIGYLAQQEPMKSNKGTLLKYFQLECELEEGEARNVLASYLFYGADVFKPLSMLSGGEWTRLRLALLVRQKPNVLLLDEPTNHLDIASREALEESLSQYPGTILVISHDRYFINKLAERVWEMEDGKVTSYLGNFDYFKEKRAERISKMDVSQNKSSGAKKRDSNQKDTSVKTVTSESKDKLKRNSDQLESQIASLESDIERYQVEMQQVDSLKDGAQLEMLWREQEERKLKLEELLNEWMELSN
ncbi:ABC-F family ATP-binding cassette domain-containing protein [Paenibacillus sp. GSMTC-2017]|uniref:ribosomal protection-like ABC-F family protein n=1 Tax=Paenibacillus sp. GSMTC-2017 TaxID=2794350 RepID=UPI0018D91984|nr:ABC-F family ATP-binding cassette domain-containing protein [Paenibacillus sp. GSMTC-2017]MBH5318343.1 ABC-F family ATP-binding cassette domain-containing protein [Paenibacillus sp. GSMTC-2017]